MLHAVFKMWQIVNKLFTCVKSTLHFTRHIFDYQHPFHIMNYQDELDSSFATNQVFFQNSRTISYLEIRLDIAIKLHYQFNIL